MHPTEQDNPIALPYPYQPPAQAMNGPAFGLVFKTLAWSILLGLLAWIGRLDFDWGSRQGIWVAVAWCMLAFIVWHIQRSRVRLDAQMIEQTWMWRRRMALRELAFIKVMRVRGLEFLIAPRIYARNLGGTFAFFYCSDRAMLDEFARLAAALQQHEHRPT
jgi:hypothetical protein